MDTCKQLTTHALGICFGYFAQEIGFISGLTDNVMIPMKTVYHTPQEKLIEFFVSIVLGMNHLKDVNRSGYPIVPDTELARAWGQRQFVDDTGVSRMLSRIGQTEYNQIKQVIFDVSKPFFEEERTLFEKSQELMIWDCDLTGLEVSEYSQTYPQSSFGHMNNNTLGKGYQLPYLVLTGLDSKTVLSAELLAGNRNSVSCLKETIRLGEQYLGIPQRRPHFLNGTLQDLKDQERSIRRHLANAQHKLEKESLSQQLLPEKITLWKNELKKWSCSKKPFSNYQKLKRRIAAKEKTVTRSHHRLLKLEETVKRYQERLQEIARKSLSWQKCKEQFETDTKTHEPFTSVILRHDGGFASQENLIWEAASGYYFITKGYNSLSTQPFIERKAGEGVPLNSVSVGWFFKNETIQVLPMLVDVLLIEQTAAKSPKHSLIIAYLPFHLPPRELFSVYNARNTVEASIKEGKSVFGLHQFKVRSEYGIKVQQLFVNFAQNFIRWFQRWAFQKTDAEFFNNIGVKEIVKTAANTMAQIGYDKSAMTLTFHEFSCYAGQKLSFENITQEHQHETSDDKSETFWHRCKRWVSIHMRMP